MATIQKLLFLAVACLCVNADLYAPPVRAIKNTIFGDETQEGHIFEHIKLFNDEEDEESPVDQYDYRLPNTTRPTHYNIDWTIVMTDRTYSGIVDIDLHATQPDVNEIIIHSAYHSVLEVLLTRDEEPVLFTHTLNTTYQFLIINTVSPLQYSANSEIIYRLTVRFEAPLRTQMSGIYESWYRNTPIEPISWMATTQFQSTSARFAFPCYDEPAFKATFDITIRRPENYRSWSNTKINTQSIPVGGYIADIYHRTPEMSTYLLAFVVAQYGSRSDNDEDPNYEVIARQGAIDAGQGDYAFEVGQHLLSNMSAHTGIDFYHTPNIKMTQAAIPDFSAGAMENWGLLTYREAYLLYDEDNTSGHFKQIIAYILSHEIAHMWYGNLVTCDWWDVLWLNEGFATYYEYYLTHWVEDYMGFDTRFINEQVHSAMLSDSVDSAHPLSHSGIRTPGQISGMFSTLSYAKGGVIIRMTEHLLGFDVHEQGLKNYLLAKSYSTALPNDLFEILQDVAVQTGAISEYPSDFSVIDYYKSFTEQAGVPILNVQVDHQTGDMYITQRRFNINTGYSTIGTNWIIPITFSTASNPDFEDTKPTHIIRNSLSIINRGSVGDEWVIFNRQQTGYYRVNYDDHTWNLIILALRNEDRTRIHEYNRAQIVNDVFQYARSGIMTYNRAFNILSFLEFETEYAPWVAAMTGFTWIRNRLAGTELLGQLETMITRWATRVMNEVTYYPRNGESFMRAYLRYQLAPIMCAMNVRSCRIAAAAQLGAMRSNEIPVPVDSRVWVYCNALRESTSLEDFDYLWTRFVTHNLYTEKITLLQSLGCTHNTEAIYRLLDEIMLADVLTIRVQDRNTAFNTVAGGNEANAHVLFAYIQANFDGVAARFGVVTALNAVASRLRTYEDIDEFQGWVWANQARIGANYRNVIDNAEASRNNLRWALDVSSDFENYFENGNEEIELITPPPAPEPPAGPIIEEQPVLIEPDRPIIPSSAVTSSLSMFLIALAAIAFRM